MRAPTVPGTLRGLDGRFGCQPSNHGAASQQTPFDKSLDGNTCLITRRRSIDFVKSPNLFKISTSIVVNTGTLVTMNPQLLVSLELVRVSGL